MFFFFFTATATTEIYTLSLHDALPIWFCAVGRAHLACRAGVHGPSRDERPGGGLPGDAHRRPRQAGADRSEEHTSELQSQSNLVCRLLLEKKNKKKNNSILTPDRGAYY